MPALPVLSAVSLVSDDVPRLAAFYALLLGQPGEGDARHRAFGAGPVALSLASAGLMEELAPGCLVGAGPGRVVIEFRVGDVDALHARLAALGVPVVKPPTTHPWGLRSAWVRDPDGNLVNLYAPAG
ncbi:MAG TPA: VOC family protein [Deinococcales bacterium]|nr:VOC family protein [Deinococcales bacterium]